ncbi:Crp/Fnr family transcriptional regulator [Pseudomonadota bacterium]
MSIDTAWFEENILLHKLNEEANALLDEVFEINRYQTGDEIISQGSVGGELYILRSGKAAITRKDGKKCIFLGHADEGALLGSMSFLSGNLSSATATAHSDCLIYKLNLDGYIKLLTKNQDLLLSLFTCMLNHSGELLRQMNVQYAEMTDSMRDA